MVECDYVDNVGVDNLLSALDSVDDLRAAMSSSITNTIGGIMQLIFALVLMVNGSSGSTNPVLFGILVGFLVPAAVAAALLLYESTRIAAEHKRAKAATKAFVSRIFESANTRRPILDSNGVEDECRRFLFAPWCGPHAAPVNS